MVTCNATAVCHSFLELARLCRRVANLLASQMGQTAEPAARLVLEAPDSNELPGGALHAFWSTKHWHSYTGTIDEPFSPPNVSITSTTK